MLSSSPRPRGARGGTRNGPHSTLGPISSSDYDSSDSDSSTSSHPHNSLLQPTSLYPPFYNRPPTPLPPSPSLTSLLLPHRNTPSINTFSAPASPRHTPLQSPDHSPSASDTESTSHLPHHLSPATSTGLGGPGGISSSSSTTLAPTDSSLAFSSHFATHTPRASPKVPTYEYYGFVLYLISTLAFGMYILWSYLPAPMLHSIGIHYYPSRWWSLALPSWLVVLVVWIYVALAGYNTGYLTKGLGCVEGVVDGVAKIAVVHAGSGSRVDSVTALGGGGIDGRPRRDWKRYWNRGTDGVIDIPIGGVCEVLYGEGRELEEWEIEDEDITNDELQGESILTGAGNHLVIGAETGSGLGSKRRDIVHGGYGYNEIGTGIVGRGNDPRAWLRNEDVARQHGGSASTSGGGGKGRKSKKRGGGGGHGGGGGGKNPQATTSTR